MRSRNYCCNNTDSIAKTSLNFSLGDSFLLTNFAFLFGGLAIPIAIGRLELPAYLREGSRLECSVI